MHRIVSEFSGDFITIPTSFSSIGYVIVNDIKIYVKPNNKQSFMSSGISNEIFLRNIINSTSTYGKVSIRFYDEYDKEFIISDVIGSIHNINQKKNKADIHVLRSIGNSIPISIKMDNAEHVQSCDTYYRESALNILRRINDQQFPDVSLTFDGNVWKLIPEITISATTDEIKKTVFGDDIINNNGCVLIRSFKQSDFEFIDSILHVKTTRILLDPSDCDGVHTVSFMLRNDKTRNAIPGYPGIRPLAIFKNRITKTVKHI